MSLPNEVHPLMLGGGSYQISRSVRLRSSVSASLNRTFVAGDTKTWTWSAWVKRGTMGAINQYLFALGSSQTYIIFNSDSIQVGFYSTNAATLYYTTTSQVFRDPSAWYHIVVAIDTTQATAANRNKLYINGTQVTAFSAATYPSQNDVGQINTAAVHRIGSYDGSTNLFDGYLTEINFVNAQQLTPSSFGETNAVTGVWQPKKYAGTYGTNGFYLNFSDNSAATAAAIGKDYSVNGNNWTPNNISVTAGATYDSMLDTPTPYDDGGNGRGNYAVLNPLSLGSTVTLSNGNLTMTEVGTYATTVSSIGVTSGKWYAEMTVGSNTYAGTCGIARLGYSSTSRLGFQANTWAYNSDGGLYYNSTQLTPTQATFTTGDVIGIAFDADNLTIQFYKNNTLQTQYYTAANSGLTAGEFYFATGHINSTSNWNFGQRPFTYTPPTGFKALNTQNLPIPTIFNGANQFAATTYTGDGTASRVISGLNFTPDFIWIKNRSSTWDNILGNYVATSAIGTPITLVSNSNAAEVDGGYIGTQTTNSLRLAVSAAENRTNGNTLTYVGWAWNAGGSTVTNTSGSISAQVRANPTAGFSIVTYTGTGVAATIGHGLGVAPSMIITKNRDSATAWHVFHTSLGATQYIVLNTTAAAVTSSASGWNNTAPTSSVFSLGASNPSSANQDVAYCFAAVAGYSAFGSYTGNGSTDGPFIYLGFRPRFFLAKVSSGVTGGWHLIDTSRSPYNEIGVGLYPNSSNAESSDFASDILSNGLKMRNTQSELNGSGNTYIYMAFAENPFKNSLAR